MMSWTCLIECVNYYCFEKAPFVSVTSLVLTGFYSLCKDAVTPQNIFCHFVYIVYVTKALHINTYKKKKKTNKSTLISQKIARTKQINTHKQIVRCNCDSIITII